MMSSGTFHSRRVGLLPAGLVALVTLSACAAEPEAAEDQWPLSEMSSLDEVRADRDSLDAAVEADVEPEPMVPPNRGPTADEEARTAAELDRPAMDMDATGPMIHTQPTVPPDFPDARFPRPEHVRGIYVNAWAAGTRSRMDQLIEIARETEVNSFVIDIKDATGYLSHRTSVPKALEIGADGERRIRDLPALLDRLEEEGIYPIARIVVVKDPILIASHPEYAIQDTAGGVWIDSKEIIWVNPFAEEVWEYNVAIAREVAEMGFPEIQWDYIRFPDAPADDMARAVFNGAGDRSRTDAIRGFFQHAQAGLEDLPVRSTADVFGVTTSYRRDIGLGQLWETFIDVVDVALPMVYPSHYFPHSFGYAEPNAYPYEIVKAALLDARERSAAVEGAGITRAWLQDFSLGLPIYGGPEVRAQIQAVYDAGLHEWILWNPSTRYSISALEPASGFESDPLIRVAGVLAPVSRRHEVIDSVATARALMAQMEAEAEADSLATPEADPVAAIPAMLMGSFVDDYGIPYSISSRSWTQGDSTRYEVYSWDVEERSVVVRAPDPEAGGWLWSRIDWLTLEEGEYPWAFCYTAYDLNDPAEAIGAEPANRAEPRTGCGGHPFSRMKPSTGDRN